jgi:hypothetical protein
MQIRSWPETGCCAAVDTPANLTHICAVGVRRVQDYPEIEGLSILISLWQMGAHTSGIAHVYFTDTLSAARQWIRETFAGHPTDKLEVGI